MRWANVAWTITKNVQIPESLLQNFEEEEKKEKIQEEERKKQQQMYSFKVVHESKTAEFEIHEDELVQAVLDNVAKAFQLGMRFFSSKVIL